MSRRIKIIVAASIAVVAVLAGLIYLSSSSRNVPQNKPPTPEIVSSATPTPTASLTPEILPSPGTVYEESIEQAAAANPVIANVPKLTPYWTVEIVKDSQEGKIVLTARVYVKPDQNEAETIKQQRQYIEQWLASIGQQPGTYILEFQAERPHAY